MSIRRPDTARRQADNGADYIDVNAGVFVGREANYLKWLVTTVQDAVETPCCIDSPDPAAIEAALELHRGTPMLNSISLEKERYEALMPIVAGTDLKIIALCMSDEGMPETTDARGDRRQTGQRPGRRQRFAGKHLRGSPGQPISTDQEFGMAFLEAILDGAIVDPLNRRMMATINAAEALAGRDEYCGRYLTAYRQEKLLF